MGDATRFAETDEMRALREQLRRDEEALAVIEAALAAIPQVVVQQVTLAAQNPNQYGLREFVAYIRSWMTKRNLFHGVHIAVWLYSMYLKKYAEAHGDEPSVASQTPRGPRAGGPFRYYAPADGRGSVVDAVFAKAERQVRRTPTPTHA